MNKKRGTIAFSRMTTGRYLALVTDDKANGICEMEMSAEQFSSTITGQHSKCELTLFPNDRKAIGNISLSRTTQERYLVLVTDNLLNESCEIEMSASEFSFALTGQQSKCDLTTFNG
jgi:hypothetical protein